MNFMSAPSALVPDGRFVGDIWYRPYVPPL
jgi:hypothetical protein